jgi:ATP-dependent helicase HrpB
LSGIEPDREALDEDAFRHAILAGYPDRVAARRAPNSPRFRLASGAGAVLTEQSSVTNAEFVVALDVRGNREPPRGRGSAAETADARIVLASRVEREWLMTTTSEIVHRYDERTGGVRAARVERYDALVLAEHPAQIDPAAAAPLLAAHWLERGPEHADRLLLRRLRFADLEIDVEALVETAAWTARRVQDITLAAALPREIRIAVDRDAPETLNVPSGRAVRLEYGDDGSVSASVKLQELFGLAETPRIGPRREPVRFALLAPNGRPVQVTRDLRSFWDRTYPEVRKELRGRYPKHPWPDDPWTAKPSARTKRTPS